jgi:predicted MPP superfamily phosphohydrolase
MIKVVVVALLILCILFLAEGRRELRFFKITRYSLCVPKFRALNSEKKIVLLADLHNKVYGRNNEKLLESIRGEKPDLILIAGDMLVGKADTGCQAALNFVIRLPSICPVYYALGNHEQRLKENPRQYGDKVYKDFINKIQKSGVKILENQSDDIMLDNLCVKISGLELPLKTYEKFKRYSVTADDISQRIKKSEPRKYNLLIAHNPVYFPAYKKWGADLTVSGHLHGGIIRLPVIGAVITPQAMLFPKYSGELSQEGEQAIAVSKGLGTHTVNLRFFNYAEVVVLHLRPFSSPPNVHSE